MDLLRALTGSQTVVCCGPRGRSGNSRFRGFFIIGFCCHGNGLQYFQLLLLNVDQMRRFKTNWRFSRRWNWRRKFWYFVSVQSNDSLSLFSVSQLCWWKLSDKTPTFVFDFIVEVSSAGPDRKQRMSKQQPPPFLFQDKHLSNSTQNCWLITRQSLYRFVREGWEGPGPEDVQVGRVCWLSFRKSSKMHQVNFQFEERTNKFNYFKSLNLTIGFDVIFKL